ncbi:hypothetical protein GOB20_24570 [Sinorhizobium meliloti]|nr:hypothetical protein [Sinorhizobium meliloti]
MKLAAFNRPWADNAPVYVNPANVLSIETVGASTNIFMSAPDRDGIFTVTVAQGIEEVRKELNRCFD